MPLDMPLLPHGGAGRLPGSRLQKGQAAAVCGAVDDVMVVDLVLPDPHGHLAGHKIHHAQIRVALRLIPRGGDQQKQQNHGQDQKEKQDMGQIGQDTPQRTAKPPCFLFMCHDSPHILSRLGRPVGDCPQRRSHSSYSITDLRPPQGELCPPPLLRRRRCRGTAPKRGAKTL